MSKIRRAGGQEEVTPLTSAPDPFVSIQRNPALEEAVVARLKKTNVMVTSGDQNCFLCGGGTLSSDILPRRHSYLKQVECFKTYLSGRRALDGVETCASCLQVIKDVWELNQEIEAIKENISRIVDRVTASGGGGEAITNKGLKKIPGPKSRRPAKSGQGSRAPNCSSTQGFSTAQDSESMEYQCDPDLLFEVKEEGIWNKEEIRDDAESDTENCFAVTPESDDVSLTDSQSVQISSKQVSRQKRKSRVAAEKILRVVASERRKKEIPDDDQSEEGEDPVISEPEDSNQEEATDSESDTSDGPQKEKRLKKSSIPSRTCPHCKKVFKLPKYVQHHIRTVHLKKATLSVIRSVPNHFLITRCEANTSHGINETFPCSSCSKKLATQKQLAIHQTLTCKVDGWTPERLQKKFNVTIRPCPEEGCGRLFSRQSDIRKHLITHTGLKNFSCSTCKKSFTSKHYLGHHICHKEEVGNHSEQESDGSETEKGSQKKTKRRTFSCSSCSKKLASRRRWAVHEATLCKVAGWTEERLKQLSVTLRHCPVEGCDKVFDELNKVQKHLITHTEYPRPPSVPAMEKVLCGTSMHPFHLTKHMKRVHQGQRPLSCPHCEKRFFSSNDRSRHIAQVHEGKKGDCKDGQSHICQECGVQYPYKSSLYQHMARVHGDESKVKYQCGSCPEKFYARNELLRHEERHLKYGWCCGDCGRNFESERKLEKHQESLDGVLCVPRKRTRRMGKDQIEDGVVIVESELQNVPEEGK